MVKKRMKTPFSDRFGPKIAIFGLKPDIFRFSGRFSKNFSRKARKGRQGHKETDPQDVVVTSITLRFVAAIIYNQFL